MIIHTHPEETALLTLLYRGKQAHVVHDYSDGQIRNLLSQTPAQEQVMLLGKGSRRGLYAPQEDLTDRLVIGHAEADLLHRHNGNIVGIWRHADKFAKRMGLHGLFTGLIITDRHEAEHYGIMTLQHLIEEANLHLFSTLRNLLDSGTSLCDIPQQMYRSEAHASCLLTFNYSEIFYL